MSFVPVDILDQPASVGTTEVVVPTEALQKLFVMQRQLMKQLNVATNEDITRPLEDTRIIETLVHMGAEVTETLQPLVTTTKPWKQKPDPVQLLIDTKEELVDVLFFWLEAAIQFGLSVDDVMTIYSAKYQKLQGRLASVGELRKTG